MSRDEREGHSEQPSIGDKANDDKSTPDILAGVLKGDEKPVDGVIFAVTTSNVTPDVPLASQQSISPLSPSPSVTVSVETVNTPLAQPPVETQESAIDREKEKPPEEGTVYQVEKSETPVSKPGVVVQTGELFTALEDISLSSVQTDDSSSTTAVKETQNASGTIAKEEKKTSKKSDPVKQKPDEKTPKKRGTSTEEKVEDEGVPVTETLSVPVVSVGDRIRAKFLALEAERQEQEQRDGKPANMPTDAAISKMLDGVSKSMVGEIGKELGEAGQIKRNQPRTANPKLQDIEPAILFVEQQLRDGVIQDRPTDVELGRMLGVSATSVNRVRKRLANEGLSGLNSQASDNPNVDRLRTFLLQVKEAQDRHQPVSLLPSRMLAVEYGVGSTTVLRLIDEIGVDISTRVKRKRTSEI